jgi:hypothetical protein
MAESMPVSNAAFCFVAEKPGAGRGEKRESVVRRHVTRAYHRRRREKDVREFQGRREVARRREEREGVEIPTADENVALAEDRLVKSSVKPSLFYNDHSEWYSGWSITRIAINLIYSDSLHLLQHYWASFNAALYPWTIL